MFAKRLVLFFCILMAPSIVLASEAAHFMSPGQALDALAAGNARFYLGQAAHPNASFSRRLVTVTEGQAPFATIIACSDSRVPVELLFDQGIGDLFVIKVAGNVADTDEIASAEYGVDHLGTPVLMVLGHTHCGAVTAVVTGAEVHGSIPELVDNIVPVAKKTKHEHPELTGDALIDQAAVANLWQAVEDLLTKSHAIANRAAQGKVLVVGGMYDLLTGKVQILGTHPKQYALVSEHATVPLTIAKDAPSETPATNATTQTAANKPAETPAKAAHDEKSDAAHTVDTAKSTETAPQGHATDSAKAEESGGGFGFTSFIIFVLLLIGAVIVLDKKILNPKE